MNKMVFLDSAAPIDLEQGISVLENFQVCVSVYISWWTGMELRNSSLGTTCLGLKVNYDSLRNRTIQLMCETTRQFYVDYTEKVNISTS